MFHISKYFRTLISIQYALNGLHFTFIFLRIDFLFSFFAIFHHLNCMLFEILSDFYQLFFNEGALDVFSVEFYDVGEKTFDVAFYEALENWVIFDFFFIRFLFEKAQMLDFFVTFENWVVDEFFNSHSFF